jgi:hypothetical protein
MTKLHPLHSVSAGAKVILNNEIKKPFLVINSLDKIDQYLASKDTTTPTVVGKGAPAPIVPSVPIELSKFDHESALRISLARKYFARVKTAVVDKDLDGLKIDHDKLNRLLDTILLGTASERIEGEEMLIFCFALFY